jgi:MFS superfamily sulfate permease-like transporter
MKINTNYLKADLQSGLVVFLVALPLCLGIALASGASPFAGIISGIIGGIVVGYLSSSQLSVTGPAAGLIAILLVAVNDMGFEALLLATVLAGVFQILLGFLKAGTVSNYFPTNVIEGMLAAIGVIIIKKQIPHAMGYDVSHEGDYFNLELGVDNGFVSELVNAVNYSHLGAIIIALVGMAIIVAFNNVEALKKIKAIPGALVAVIAGIVLNEIWIKTGSSLAITGADHLVSLPVVSSFEDFTNLFTFPDFSQIANTKVWIVAGTIAIVASIETLLCLEATDKLDPLKRFSNANTELKAQGVGNMLAGLIGGIPMTSVIVRSSANINSGGRTKIATITHGVLLLVAVLAIPFLLNKIPLATLAAVLILIGYKLANPSVFKHMWHNGKYQFIPFIITLLAVVFTDLLKGVGIGLVFSVLFILRGNMKLAYFFKQEKHKDGEVIKMKLAQEVSFLNKASIKQTLIHLPENSSILIDASDCVYIDYDVLVLIRDFYELGAKDKNIKVDLVGFKEVYHIENTVSHVS